MSVGPVEGRGNLPPEPQVKIEKKADYGLFKTYELTVTIGDKTVTVKMNTFRTPWNQKIFATNLYKKISNAFNLEDVSQVDSLMKAFMNASVEMEKQCRVNPEKKKLRQDANVSVVAMTLFFNQYPQSLQLQVQPSDFETVFLKANSMVAIVKRDMALLYHELQQENPREEVIRSLAEKIDQNIKEINKDGKLEEATKHLLIKSFDFIKKVVLEREESSLKLSNLKKAIMPKEGKGMEEKEFQALLSSIENAPDISSYLSLLDDPKDLNFNQFVAVVNLLNKKIEGIVQGYRDTHKAIVELRESEYVKVDKEEQKRQEELGLERDRAKEAAQIKYEEGVSNLRDLRENGVINQRPIQEVNGEIHQLNESLKFLELQMYELNKELDQLITVTDERPSFMQVFSGLLEDKVEGSEVKELVLDLATLAIYPLQSAKVKLCQLKAKNQEACQPLTAKFKILKEQHEVLQQKKRVLVDQREIFNDQMNQMSDNLDAEYQKELEQADRDYDNGKALSIKVASQNYQERTRNTKEKELTLQQQDLALRPSQEKCQRLVKEGEEYKKELVNFQRKTKAIEGQLGVDFSEITDSSKVQSLVPLQLMMLCGLAALGWVKE